jgi:small-conductance mechanosensitive channel
MSTVFSRILGPGDLVEYGGERGTVREIGLVSLNLEGENGVSIRVPHARSLWHATRVVQRRQR